MSKPPAPKRVFWLEVRETNPTRWVTSGAYIERRPDGYLPFVHGQPQGIYPTMAAAATVAERVLSNTKRDEVMR